MELSATSQDGTYFLYEESFWTGKKKLIINGMPAAKLSKKVFGIMNPDGTMTEYTLKGSFITGVSVLLNNGETVVLAKNKWYDWIFIFLPVVGIAIGALFCGAIGGFLSAIFTLLGAVLNAKLARTKIPVLIRILLQLVVAVVVNAIWFGLWFVIAAFLLAAIEGGSGGVGL